MSSFDNGATWSDIESVAAFEVIDDGLTGGSLGEEDVFPSTIKRVGSDDMLHMVFQTDLEAGLHVQGDMHAITSNEIIYYPIDIAPLRPVGLNDFDMKTEGVIVYPNPANDIVYIECNSTLDKDELKPGRCDRTNCGYQCC